MSRIARVVVPGVPHHVTQRGNRGARVFFGDGDDAVCLDLIAAARKADTEVWAWCLMPNHVHIVRVPTA
jgi:putative transposase